MISWELSIFSSNSWQDREAYFLKCSTVILPLLQSLVYDTKQGFNVPTFSTPSFPQPLPARPNARKRQDLDPARSGPTSLSVTSRAATSPCSAGTPQATAGVWTASLAQPSRAPPCAVSPTVRKVKDTDFWFNAATATFHARLSGMMKIFFSLFILGTSPRHLMLAPSLMQRAVSIDDGKLS